MSHIYGLTVPPRKHTARWLLKERQCTYNVTLGRAHATFVAVEKYLVLRIPSVCLYP